MPAEAADLPARPVAVVVPPAFTWAGAYIGANGGYGWGERTGRLTTYTPGSAANAVQFGGNVPTAFELEPDGGVAGGQVGYNWQWGRVVAGVEADLQWAGIRKAHEISLPGNGLVPAVATIFSPSYSRGSSEIEWFGTLRARLGYAPESILGGRLLVYATGGLAYGETQNRANIFFNPPITGVNFVGEGGATDFGWTAGAGVEYALTRNVSLKAEYLYVDLGPRTITVMDPVQFPNDAVGYRFENRAHIVRGGLNIRFDSLWGR